MKPTRREFARALGLVTAALAAPPLLGGQAPIPRRRITFNAEQTEDLNRISAWLNALSTLTADFVQTSAQGRMAQGTFCLARPGRLRFEYLPPSPLLIVATGGDIYVRNSRLNTVDRTSASDTPLGLLLSDTVDLKRNPAVLGIERQPGTLLLRARSGTNRMSENIIITFAAPDIQLRQWVVKDLQGDPTTVVFSRMQTGVSLPETLFDVPVKAPRMRGSN